jgi:hypothetical protein
MRRAAFRLTILIVALTAGVIAHAAWFSYHPPFVRGQDKPAPYAVLADNMISIIYIGVDTDISERQLYATLSQAADEHMDDPARDYLFAPYLGVEAYLMKDGRQSSVKAGSLRRYVPPKNPDAETFLIDTLFFRKADSFSVSLQQARRSF